MNPNETRRTLLAWSLATGPGAGLFRKLRDAMGGVEALLAAGPKELSPFAAFSKPLSRVVKEGLPLAEADAQLALAAREGVRVVGLLDEGYPELLKAIHDPPAALFVRGRFPFPDAPAAALVGSRHASTYGRRMAREFAESLALSGVTVVSGLASGIDAAAHEGALEGGGFTVAVLGSGLLRPYPKENLRLFRRIAEEGAVVSEYPLEADARPAYFPVRNRIVAGLSRAVAVVEAKERSGALITANLALEENRDVYAVPGNVDSPLSAGANALLKEGARPLLSAADLLEGLGLRVEPRAEERFGGDEGTLFSLLGTGELHVDELAERSGLGYSKTAAALSRLELAGSVRQLPGKRFLKRRKA